MGPVEQPAENERATAPVVSLPAERDQPASPIAGRAMGGARPLASALVLMVADWCSIFACLVAVWWVRGWPLVALFPDLGPVSSLWLFVTRLYGLAPWLLAFAASRLYTRRTLFWEETRRVLHACTVATLFAIVILFVEHNAEDLSRLVLGGLWCTTIAVVPLVRFQIKRLLAASGLWRKRVLILGAGEAGTQVVMRIRNNPDLGYQPVAFVDDPASLIGKTRLGLPVHGPLESAPQIIRELDVQDVVLAMPSLPRERLHHLVSSCEGDVQSIRLVPDLFGLASVGVEAEDLDGMLLLHMRWNLAKPWNLAVKRSFDVVVALITCVLLAPILALVAIAVRLDSPGPALFRQARLGRGHRWFTCLKFRTMYVDNEERLRRHLLESHDARADWGDFAKLRSSDPRVTRVGAFLRRWSVDELAQLANVLRGDMSLVGPRPYLPSEMERMGDVAKTVRKAPPGITGLWQVSGRNNVTFEQRLRLDEYYTRNWSLWLDVIVLLKTISVVLRREGAF